jgi:hypothetical protein
MEKILAAIMAEGNVVQVVLGGMPVAVRVIEFDRDTVTLLAANNDRLFYCDYRAVILVT